jgi:hypothetical protein
MAMMSAGAEKAKYKRPHASDSNLASFKLLSVKLSKIA